MWRMVKIEDTGDWPVDGPLRKRGIRTWNVYAFDDGARTFCCELTPSRCLWYLGFVWDLADDAEPLSDEESEQWFDFLLENGRPYDDVAYYHCGFADKMSFEDVTSHVDADELAEHEREHNDVECQCDERFANQIREWACTGEVT